MTPDNHIREALTIIPHNEEYREVRYLLHQALGIYKEVHAKDPRIKKIPMSKEGTLVEETDSEWTPKPPTKSTQELLKEFGW